MGQSGAIRCNFNGSASIWAPSGPISCESAMRSLRLYLVICSYGSAHFCAGVALDPYILIVVASVSGSVLSQRSVVLWSCAFLRPPPGLPTASNKNENPLLTEHQFLRHSAQVLEKAHQSRDPRAWAKLGRSDVMSVDMNRN